MSRSHFDLFTAALAKAPENKMSVAALALALGPDWDIERVAQKARQFDDDESVALSLVHGGLQYFGTERCKDPAIYKQLQRGIRRSWATSSRIPRVDEVYITSRLVHRGDGDWTTPDLVVSSTRKGWSELHAIEAEQPAGFDVRSVYQAYEQARGAHWAWVFYTGEVAEEGTMRRVSRAAKELGVGVVHATRPSAPSKWNTVIPARRRDVVIEEERALRTRLRIEPASPYLTPESTAAVRSLA